MEREAALGLMRRAVDIGVQVWPEMAARHMEVPLDYFTDPAIFAEERALYERSPLALIASCEIPDANDFVVRNAVGRSHQAGKARPGPAVVWERRLGNGREPVGIQQFGERVFGPGPQHGAGLSSAPSGPPSR